MNPYAILGAVLLWLGSMAGTAYLGWDYRDARVARDIKEATDDALQKAAKQATADMAAALDRTKAETAAAERSRRAQGAGVVDALNSADPRCLRGATSFRLLGNAIDAANGAPDTPGGVSEAMPGVTQTSGRQGLDDSAVGVRSN